MPVNKTKDKRHSFYHQFSCQFYIIPFMTTLVLAMSIPCSLTTSQLYRPVSDFFGSVNSKFPVIRKI